jgi:hypothetical protein
MQPFLLLLPKKWNTASNLYQTIKMLVICKNKFTFNEISNIWIIINSSRNEPSSGHGMTSSGDEHQIDLLTFKK